MNKTVSPHGGLQFAGIAGKLRTNERNLFLHGRIIRNKIAFAFGKEPGERRTRLKRFSAHRFGDHVGGDLQLVRGEPHTVRIATNPRPRDGLK